MDYICKLARPFLLSSLIIIVSAGQVFSGEEDYFKRHAIKVNKADEKAKEIFPERLNPHDQISDTGEILEKKCLFCHPEAPDIDDPNINIDNVSFPYDKFKDLQDLCFTCHPERMHPGGGLMGSVDKKWDEFGGAPNHLVKPNEELLDRMEDMLVDFFTIMPLDPKTNEITCITCHNPHERGILSGRADVGADTEIRIRTSGSPLCIICHEKN